MTNILAAALLMFGLAQTPAVPDKDDFVQLERTTCFGTCPAYVVRIYGDGRVTWQGTEFVQVTGAATSRVAPETAQSLIGKLRTNGFWSLNAGYSKPVTDNPTYITTAHIGKDERKVSNYAAAAPQLLQSLEAEIDQVANTHQWIHGNPETELMMGLNIRADAGGSKPGVTALMRASIIADTAEIQRLIAAKSNVNAVDSSGWPALVYAVYGAKSGIVDAATYSSGIESVKLLLDAGADPNIRSKMDQTPLMATVAAYYSPVEKTKLLLAAKADVNAQDKNGQTVMMLFVRGALGRNLNTMYEQQVEILSAFRAAGARTDLKDGNGLTVFDLLDQELMRWMTPTRTDAQKAVMRKQYEQLLAVLQKQ